MQIADEEAVELAEARASRSGRERGSVEELVRRVGGPRHRLCISRAELVEGRDELAPLERKRRGEQLTLRAFTRDQRGAHFLRERHRREHVLHRCVEECVDHREQPEREQLIAVALARELTETSAHERRLDQLARLLVDSGEDAEGRPALDVVDTEQHEGAADRVDLAAQAEERRVDVAQQAVAQGDVPRDERLELGDLDPWILQSGHELEDRQPVGGHRLGLHPLGLAEEVALKQLEAERDAVLVILARLHLLRHGSDPVAREAGKVLLDRRPISPENVHLHDVDVLERGGEQLVARVVVEGDLVAASAMVLERLYQGVVDQLVLEQLEHDTAARQRLRKPLEQEVARDVDPRATVTDDGVEAELGERVDHHGGGGLVVVRDDRDVLVRAAEQQLVPDDVEVQIEDRLTRYEDPRHCSPLARSNCLSGYFGLSGCGLEHPGTQSSRSASRRNLSGLSRNDFVSRVASQSSQPTSATPRPDSSYLRAPGSARRIGEWVAMMNCEPASAARAITARNASALVTESAASGSSSTYSPSRPKRFAASARNDSPCDCACIARPP